MMDCSNARAYYGAPPPHRYEGSTYRAPCLHAPKPCRCAMLMFLEETREQDGWAACFCVYM